VASDKSAGNTKKVIRDSAAGGGLYVVATPIGNLQDISARALEVLASVDVILAEDTRHSAKLLGHYGISTPCRSFHDHNESRQVARIAQRIADGDRIALISDAGTPLISDPGFRLVAALREQGYAVISIPGPCALVSALSVAGLATDRFCFEGFLPARTSARQQYLQSLARESRTLVFYESPRRILQALADLGGAFGGHRPAVVARELTKIHESVIAATLSELHSWLEEHPAQCRGEFVIVVAGAAPDTGDDDDVRLSTRDLLSALMAELPLKQAVSVAVRLTGAKRNALYQQALALTAAGGEEGEGGP
jgi:16S rRNA (cytidine1402-2'-O)-methyltransferase